MKEIMKVEGIEKVKLRKKDPSQQGLEFGRDLTNEEFLGLLDGIGGGLEQRTIEDRAKRILTPDGYEGKKAIAEEIIKKTDELENGEQPGIEYYEKGFDIGRKLSSRNLASLLAGMSNGLDIKILNHRMNTGNDEVDNTIDLRIMMKDWAEKLKDIKYL